MTKVTITTAEKQQIISAAKAFLESKQKEFSDDESILYVKMHEIVNDEYCEAYGVPNDLLYEMFCLNEIAEVFFSHSKNSEFMSKALIECIDRENYQLAKNLVLRMEHLSRYKNYIPDKWESAHCRTMLNVISHYPLPQYTKPYNDPVSNENRKFAFGLTESLIPYFSESSQKELYVGLMFADETSKYFSLYLDNLLYVVKNYAQKSRRKNGFGTTVSINKATRTITESFNHLARLNRIDVIKQILNILKDAGDDLKPMNYKMFLQALQFSFEDIYNELL